LKTALLVLAAALVLLSLGMTRDGYWENVRVLEKEVYDSRGLYGAGKTELGKLCAAEGKKCRSAYRKLLPYFAKAEEITIFQKTNFADFAGANSPVGGEAVPVRERGIRGVGLEEQRLFRVASRTF